MGKLTDVQLRNWVKAGKPLARADGDGLTFTLSAKGTASWVLRYRFGGRPRELTLGRYPDISLAGARNRAGEERAKVQNGIDVATEKQREKREAAAAMTFRQLATDYMAKVFPTLAANTVKQRRQYIEAVILPRFAGRRARDIEAGDVVALIEAVGAKSRRVAEVVFQIVSEVFKHGIGRHVVKANPCASLTVAAVVGKAEPKRARLKLSQDELREVLRALPSIGQQNDLAVRILLATCVRIGELARAEWAHLDLKRGEWLIPDENSKSGRGFVVPLVPQVVGWFRALEPFAGGSRYVLPARQRARARDHGGEIHFEPRTLNAALSKLCRRLGDKCRRFTPHDLRSTARSYLAALGVSVVVAERCLNHSLGGLLAVYDQHDYLTERRAALELWTSFLEACEAGKEWNVRPLRQTVG